MSARVRVIFCNIALLRVFQFVAGDMERVLHVWHNALPVMGMSPVPITTTGALFSYRIS